MRLIDADAFLKRNEVYADCEFIHPMYQNTLREIVDDEPTIPTPRWVRCDEALPEIGQRVIVYDGWMQFMTRKDDQRLNGKMYWENEEGNWERVDDEAYWMPIEPPKEDA